MKTISAKKGEVGRNWVLVDASGQPLGRMASRVAARLRGKHNPLFTPHVDTGDFVVVINAEKVKLTGKKMDKKLYHWHTGYIGGLKTRTAKQMIEDKPEMVIFRAVKGMLPKNRLGRKLLKKLKVYRGPAHPHEAQRPETLEL